MIYFGGGGGGGGGEWKGITSCTPQVIVKAFKGLQTDTKMLDDALSALKLKENAVNALEWKNDVQIVARGKCTRGLYF